MSIMSSAVVAKERLKDIVVKHALENQGIQVAPNTQRVRLVVCELMYDKVVGIGESERIVRSGIRIPTEKAVALIQSRASNSLNFFKDY